MKEKLKELKNKKSRVESELNAIAAEIRELEQQMLDSDKNSYKGKWYYKEEDWWDEYDAQHESYDIVYIKDVIMDYGSTHLVAVIMKFPNYWKLENFEIEVDENFPICDLKGMKEMTDHEFSQMDETIGQVFKCLFDIYPQLKDKLK